MKEIGINNLIDEDNYLIENIPNDIIIVGKIKELFIKYKYEQLDLSGAECGGIYYINQEEESIKNHKLPNSLQKLICCNNKLISLPDLPDSLKELHCYNNKLTSLVDLPNSLQVLYCDINQLTLLPDLPNSLEILSCARNQLTGLPDLPNSLKYLYCSDNKLTSLPDLPNSLGELNCSNNILTSLPELPTSLNNIKLGNLILEKIEYNTDYKNVNFYIKDSKITISNYIIKSKVDYVSYMEDYEKYLLSKVKSARK